MRPRPTFSFEGTVAPFIPVWIALPPTADRVASVWAELGPVETKAQYDSVISVGLERIAELTAVDDAVEETGHGDVLGLDEWNALRGAIVAEGVRRAMLTSG